MDSELKFELKRKLFHFFSLILVLIYFYVNKYFSHNTALLTLTLILIFLLFIEFLKIRMKKRIPLFHPLYRKNEENGLSGGIYLVLGIIIAFAVFNFEIALVAILMMVFGDITSSLINRSFGKHKIRNSNVSWEGIIGEFFVNLLVGIIFLNFFVVVLIMALTATFIETVLTSSDDNLAVPIFTGFMGQCMLIFFRILGVIR